MKRTVLIVTAAAVALTPLAATAAPAKTTKRTVTYDYSGFQAAGANGAFSFSSENGCQALTACWDFDTKKGEKTIEITAADASGSAVGFQVFYDDEYAENVVLFCGKGKITVSPRKGHAISVRTSAHDCEGLPSEGTLTAVVTGTK